METLVCNLPLRNLLRAAREFNAGNGRHVISGTGTLWDYSQRVLADPHSSPWAIPRQFGS